MDRWAVEFVDAARREFAAWPPDLKSALIRIFDRIQALGLERVREPLVKHIEGPLWEMRPSANRLEGRALYISVRGRRVIVVLAFIKKKQKTPRRLIELALARAEQVK